MSQLTEILDLKSALFDVLDAIGALGGKWYELTDYGISKERAKEIVVLIEPEIIEDE